MKSKQNVGCHVKVTTTNKIEKNCLIDIGKTNQKSIKIFAVLILKVN